MAYLQEAGFRITYDSLIEEAKAIVYEYELADNISLPVILQDFEVAFDVKFNKKPIISRRTSLGPDLQRLHALKRSIRRAVPISDENQNDGRFPDEPLRVIGINPDIVNASREQDSRIRRQLQLPPSVHENAELRDLTLGLIASSYPGPNDVRWEDIAGLDDVKCTLKESVELPLKYPQFFTGSLLQPWRGILLFGPPGTGKTMLAKAVATTTTSNFISVTPSSLISKWRGDSEKLVRCLFDLLQHNKPCVLFIDEIDCILSNEHGDSHEHESSRRMKAEFLTAIDGISSALTGVSIIAASNSPWDLSPPILRRFEKRILVDNPDSSSRTRIVSHLLPQVSGISEIIESTGGWSGDDLRVLCKEAAMVSLRRIVASGNLLGAPLVTQSDLLLARSKVRPSCRENARYRLWSSDFGTN